MNTGFRGVLPMYDIFGCAADLSHNFRHLMLPRLAAGYQSVICICLLTF